jgi:hypothetical protein
LAAGVIGAGLAWILFGSRGAAGAASTAATIAKRTGAGIGGAAQKAAVTLQTAATEAGYSAASIIPDVALPNVKELNDSVRAFASGLQTTGDEYRTAIQSNIAASFERQPLLLGALGLAIGAGIASTFAITKSEQEWMGAASGATRDLVQSMASETKARTQMAVQEMQQEASRQGLTTDAAKEFAVETGDKIKAAAVAATDSLKRSNL